MQILGQTKKILWGSIRLDTVYGEHRHEGYLVSLMLLWVFGVGVTIIGNACYLHVQVWKLFLGVNLSWGGNPNA